MVAILSRTRQVAGSSPAGGAGVPAAQAMYLALRIKVCAFPVTYRCFYNFGFSAHPSVMTTGHSNDQFSYRT